MKLLISIIIIIIIAIVHFLAVDKKRFHLIWTKKTNENQPRKRENNIFV